MMKFHASLGSKGSEGPGVSPSSVACLIILFASVVLPSSATAESWLSSKLRCDTQYASAAEWRQSEANADLYNGLTFLTGTALLSSLGEPTRRWSAINRLDDESRDGLRIGSPGARRKADLASDLTLITSLAVIPLASIGAKFLRTGDCIEAWDMTTDFIESFGLTLMITESLKLATGRPRPFVRDCGPGAQSDATCDGDDRFKSFISGHSSLAATGAGLTCAFSFKREAWGSSTAAKWTPCLLGTATALSTGLLRVAADRHWLTDVASGFLIGATVGYFDTWGPFDLLRYEKRDRAGRIQAQGVLLPAAVEGRAGFRFSLRY